MRVLLSCLPSGTACLQKLLVRLELDKKVVCSLLPLRKKAPSLPVS